MNPAAETQAQPDIPAGGPVPYWLISMLPRAHDVPPEETDSIKTDTWDDEGSKWHIKLNGSPNTTARIIDPIGNELPSPSQTPFYPGTFLVFVDTGDGQEAVCCVHSTHIQSFTNPGDEQAAQAWETALICAVRERLVELDLEPDDGDYQIGAEDLPPAKALVEAHRDRTVERADGPDPGGESS